MRGAIPYRGGLLAPGSHAFKLHSEGLLKELDAHLKQVHQAAVARGERKE